MLQLIEAPNAKHMLRIGSLTTLTSCNEHSDIAKIHEVIGRESHIAIGINY